MAQKTFLEICQDTAREARIPGTGPSTVVGQTGKLGDVVRWVSQSYEEIQNRNGGHWRWLRHEFTIAATASDDTYEFTDAVDSDSGNPIDRFSAWRLNYRGDPPKIFLTSSTISAERWMIWSNWDWFKQIYKIGTRIEGAPAHITIDPQDRILIGPIPNDAYTITGEYWRSAQILTANGDIPEMPPQFHSLITWYALEHYGYSKVAEEAIARAQKKSKSFMRQLEKNQLERFRKARSLA